MPMYKDTDINAALIGEKFPNVFAEIQSQAAAGSPEITAESLKTSHPEVYSAIYDDGKAASGNDTAAAVDAERERITSINALARPGAESIISAALADSAVTADAVKLQLFDADEKNRKSAVETRRSEAQKLAGELDGLNNPEEEESEGKGAHASIMTKINKGEK